MTILRKHVRYRRVSGYLWPTSQHIQLMHKFNYRHIPHPKDTSKTESQCDTITIAACKGVACTARSNTAVKDLRLALRKNRNSHLFIYDILYLVSLYLNLLCLFRFPFIAVAKQINK